MALPPAPQILLLRGYQPPSVCPDPDSLSPASPHILTFTFLGLCNQNLAHTQAERDNNPSEGGVWRRKENY